MRNFWKIKYPAVIGAILAFGASAVFGCMCANQSGDDSNLVDRNFENASYVFTGKAVAFEYQKGILDPFIEKQVGSDGKPLAYEMKGLKFEIERWWKTELPPVFFISTMEFRSLDGLSVTFPGCERQFKIGKSYLVYASGTGREVHVSACTRTNPLEDAQYDLKILGAGKKPKKINQ